jgi:hypothetical protein
MVQAHCMLNTYCYKHTLRLCKNYCFSMATVVMWPRLSVTYLCTLAVFFVFHINMTWTVVMCIKKYVTYVKVVALYPLFNKNQAAWNFLSPEREITWRTVAIIIQVFYFPHICAAFVVFLCLRFITINRAAYINQRHQYIRFIWS